MNDMAAADGNARYPHGGRLVAAVAPPERARRLAAGLPEIAIRDQLAYEVVNLAYGVFSPLDGFMGRDDLDAVARRMTLSSGLVWGIPIVFDLPAETAADLRLAAGDALLLTYQGQPLARLEVAEVYRYDRQQLAALVYGTSDPEHPGVARTLALGEVFIGGAVTLLNPPAVNPPFDKFWQTPAQLQQRMAAQGWRQVVAHQTRNVPHAGHEWMMKGAMLAANADGILVSAVIGEKKIGDYIDEAIVLTHQLLRDEGFFRPEIHQTSTLLWDMRYAGPREAVFHAIVRKNLGCTHHMFGRDHAGVGDYYARYAAHEVFDTLPNLGIKSVLTLEWWYCPVCESVAYEGICGHRDGKQDLAGRLIRRIISGGEQPSAHTLRPQVLQKVRECAEEYGMGSPFVTPEYLEGRTPVLAMRPLPEPPAEGGGPGSP